MSNCRICLKSNKDLSSIYDPVGGRYLPAIIYNISGVKILRTIEPEAQICYNCKTATIIAESIILRCQETEQYVQYERLKRTTNQIQPILENDECSSDTGTEDTESSNSESQYTCEEETIEPTRPEEVKSKTTRKKTKASKSKKLTCEHCNFGCNTARGLVRHRREAHQIDDDKIFPCGMCDKRFPWKSTLNRHIEMYHNTLPEDKKFHCNQCGKVYISQKHLTEHQNQRHGPRRFRCVEPNCNQSFTRAFTLRRHFLTTHQNETRYRCIDCNENFKVYDHWKYHNKIVHNNQKRDFKNYKQ